MEILDIELIFASEAEARAPAKRKKGTATQRFVASRTTKKKSTKKKASDAALMKEARAKGYAKKKPAKVAKKVIKAVKDKGLPKRVAKKIVKTSKAASKKRSHSTATKKKISASLKAYHAGKGKKRTTSKRASNKVPVSQRKSSKPVGKSGQKRDSYPNKNTRKKSSVFETPRMRKAQKALDKATTPASKAKAKKELRNAVAYSRKFHPMKK